MATSASSWSTANIAGAVNRVPAADDLRSNMVRGGFAEGHRTHRARARNLRASEAGVEAARSSSSSGIDVIDGYLTEINVTSPTGIRAIQRLGGPDIAAKIWDCIEKKRG